MNFLKSGNPALKEGTFSGTVLEGIDIGEEMTVRGTMNKFGIMMLLLLASTIFSWNQFYAGSNPMPLMLVGVFGCLIVYFAMRFKSDWAHILGPIYAVLQGLFVGSVSAQYDYVFAEVYPGLIMQAIGLTVVVALVMFVLYQRRIIKVTEKFRSIITVATISIGVFYLIQWITFLAMGAPIAAFTNAATPLGIGFSVLVVCLAALNLLLDFDMIEKGVESRAPKKMEWLGAVGLLITLVWLYLEILRLLSKLKDR